MTLEILSYEIAAHIPSILSHGLSLFGGVLLGTWFSTRTENRNRMIQKLDEANVLVNAIDVKAQMLISYCKGDLHGPQGNTPEEAATIARKVIDALETKIARLLFIHKAYLTSKHAHHFKDKKCIEALMNLIKTLSTWKFALPMDWLIDNLTDEFKRRGELNNPQTQVAKQRQKKLSDTMQKSLEDAKATLPCLNKEIMRCVTSITHCRW